MKVLVPALAGLLVSTALLTPALAENPAPNSIAPADLTNEISQIDSEISSAKAEAKSYSGGLIQSLIQARVQTLELTRAILQNRKVAGEGGATVAITVPSSKPDPDRAAAILKQIDAQKGVVKAAEAAAKQSGGLVQAIALSRVETEKLTLANLRAAWLQAKYGAVLPISVQPPSSTASKSSTKAASASPAPQTDTAGATADAPEWADPAHPEIDYTSGIFSELHKEGFKISGWWGILSSKAQIDDSPKVLSINVSDYGDGFQVSHPALQVACSEGTPAVVYNADTYIMTDYSSSTVPTTYRIDENPPQTDHWSKLTGSKGSGLFDRRGEEMIRKLYSAKKLFVRIVESNGEKHDALFNLAGARPALEAVATACKFSLLELSRDDYRAIQTMLNAGGYSAGTPDGQWGPGSRAAMKRYQEDQGLHATGVPDRPTLEKMGLKF